MGSTDHSKIDKNQRIENNSDSNCFYFENFKQENSDQILLVYMHIMHTVA